MSTVVCVGEVLFDLLAQQKGVSSELVSSWTALPGGAPANVACALVKMGDRSRFIGCVGADEAGKALAAKLADVGVDTSGLQYHPTAPTRQVQVLRTNDGDRYFGGFGDVPTTDFADAQLSQMPESVFINADFLMLGTIALAYSNSAASTWQAVELARSHGLKILVDVNWRPTFWLDSQAAIPKISELLATADYVKFAREEADLIYGAIDPTALHQLLPQATGIFVTDGGNICEYWLAGESGRQPAFKVNAIDTTGAGDAFVAGLLHQLGIAEKSPTAIVRYAAAAGALTTLQPGAIDAQPTDARIQAFLAGNP
jgi:fructokinase